MADWLMVGVYIYNIIIMYMLCICIYLCANQTRSCSSQTGENNWWAPLYISTYRFTTYCYSPKQTMINGNNNSYNWLVIYHSNCVFLATYNSE